MYKLDLTLKTTCPLDLNPAVFFSGGLDSSIIISELLGIGKNPIAFTLDTENKSSYSTSDTRFSKQFVSGSNIEHKIISPNPNDFDDFIHSIDVPIGDGAFFFNWLLAKEISRSHKVALSGAGADELFGGYNRHIAFYRYKQNKNILVLLSKLRFLLNMYPKGHSKRLLKTFFSSISSNERLTFLNFTSLKLGLGFYNSEKEALFSVKQMFDHDISNFLCQDVLSLSDQAGMAHGLEIRSPFLDTNVYNFSQSLNSNSKLESNGKKHLKECYSRNKALSSVINRKKEGFGVPFISFFGVHRLDQLYDDVNELRDFTSKNELSSIKKIISLKDDNYSNEYWTLQILSKWLSL